MAPALLTVLAVLAAAPAAEPDTFAKDKAACEAASRRWNGEIDQPAYVKCRRDRDAQAERAEKLVRAKVAAEEEEADRKAVLAERAGKDADAQREQQVAQAEQQRAAEAAAANAEWIEQRMKDEAFMRRVRSAQLCLHRATRAAALKEIEEEKKYSKIGGVTNTEKIYALQVEIRESDKHLAEGALLKPAAIACSDVEMKAYVTCFFERAAQTYADTEACRQAAPLVRFVR